MLEKQLITNVNKHIPKTIFSQSMTSASLTTNGTPDRYYDGAGRDLWVEYKQLKAKPRNGIVVGDYSSLQRLWMDRRFANGGNVIGVVGLPDRTACIQFNPGEWTNGTDVAFAVPLKEVAAWITAHCLGESVFRR